MIKKYLKIFFVSAFALNAFAASAQWNIGAQGGATLNLLSTESGYAYDRTYGRGVGYSVGVPVQYEFIEWFALQTELSYTQKNYTWSRSGERADSQNKVTNSFIQLPLMARFSFGGKRLRGFLNIGGYVGYWVSSHIEGNESQYFYEMYDSDNKYPYYYNEPVEFDNRRDNRFDAGLAGGIGIQYQINPRIRIMAESRYYVALTDMQKQYMLKQFPRYNNTGAVQIGLMFTLGKIGK